MLPPELDPVLGGWCTILGVGVLLVLWVNGCLMHWDSPSAATVSNGSWLWFSPSVQDRRRNESQLDVLLVSTDFYKV